MKKSIQLIKANQKLIIQIAVALFFLGMGVFFLKNERAELGNVTETLTQADPFWFAVGMVLVVAYIWVMGLMYQFSFKAIYEKISLQTAIILFLKRNLVSVFLPAGVLTNMVFFNNEVAQKEGVSKTKIYFASSIYTLCSILSTLILGVPVVLWLLFRNVASNQHIMGVVGTVVIIILGALLWLDLKKKGVVYQFLQNRFPSVFEQFESFREQAYDSKQFWIVLLLSVVIEIIGIAHLYISMMAISGTADWSMAVLGYSIVLLLLMSSPFLRGIGAIEVSLVYLLRDSGLADATALSVSFLFRFFEFWGLLFIGLGVFLVRKDNLVLRILPAFLLFILGVVNVLSALSPALQSRILELRTFLPLEAINASNYLVLFSGFLMFVVSVYLVRGIRFAWWLAVVLSSVSLVGHLFKGIDFEEATIALITLLTLLYQRKQYYLKIDLKLANRFWLPGIVAIATVFLFGTTAFYFLNRVHFNGEFTFYESFVAMLQAFFLINSDLEPVTKFGGQFLLSVNGLGLLSLAYLVFIFFRPYIFRDDATDHEERQKAIDFVAENGDSNLDYFKTYEDKQYWFSENGKAMVAFKNTSVYAIALENPVVKVDSSLQEAITEFDAFCKANSLRSTYYRVPEQSVDVYTDMGKKALPVGQEAFVNLTTFTLEGGQMKPFRNGISKVTKIGLTFHVNDGPQTGAFMQQLKAVSDAWLVDMERTEISFSQGIFDEQELKNQRIFSVQDAEGKILAFANEIPSSVPLEANFDLIRKTADAPGGTMDFLFIRMFEHFKANGFTRCTLGMVPMSGITEPTNLQERVVKTAYEKIKRFSAYRNLRFYKEKYNPEWEMKYLVYDSAYDLLFIPSAIEKVIAV